MRLILLLVVTCVRARACGADPKIGRIGRKILVWGLLAVMCLATAHAADVTTGTATYYGWRHHGRIMADGQPFRAQALSAASRTLPLGTCIRVTHVANRRSVVVRITDRGPVRADRILDLSLGAAFELRMIWAGKALVRIERLPHC